LGFPPARIERGGGIRKRQLAATERAFQMRLSKAQREVLTMIRDGKPFCEFLTPDRSRLFFRTLGSTVHAKLNYVVDGRRVGYKTFWVLFKHNLIQPSRYKGGLSPQNGITQFHLTERGLSMVPFVPSSKANQFWER
jgi:hypothetical protein